MAIEASQDWVPLSLRAYVRQGFFPTRLDLFGHILEGTPHFCSNSKRSQLMPGAAENEREQLLRAQTLQLAEQKAALDKLSEEVQHLRRLAAVSGEWYWQQDTQYRFVELTTRDGGDKLDSAVVHNAMGICRWDLPDSVALSMSWEAHRAVLDARQPFREFEYRCLLPDGQTRYFSISGMPLFDGNRFTGYSGTAHDISATKRFEESQRRASHFLDGIIDNLPVACHLKSVQKGHPIVLWNKAAEALYGIPREDAVGRTVHQLWPKDDADRMHAADLELIRSTGMQEFPDRAITTKHSGTVHIHLRKILLRDMNGAVSHILVSAVDISERLATELSLRRSQEQFRSLTQLSADWYWETDSESRFTLVSGGRTDEIRSNLTHFLGKTRWEVTDAQKHQVDWTSHKAQLDRRETFRDYEYERNYKGQKRVQRISGEPVFDEDGTFKGYRGVGTDITARHVAEKALRTTEAKFRAVIAVLAEGLLLRDAEGRIVDCNASAERILGKPLAQMKGEMTIDSDWQMLREDGSLMTEEERPISVAIRTGLPQTNVVICYRRPEVAPLWLLLNLQPLFEGEGVSPSGFVTTITDISSRKRAETEIVRLNVDLEKRVSRRTAQLEAANRELEAFSYSVAHDLRSPLSTIDGFSALLAKAIPPEYSDRTNHYVNRIRTGVQRMGELTDGLLSLAQLSRTSLKWDTVNLSEQAEAVIRYWSERDPGRTLHTTVEPSLLVRGDGALLRQVLENLIANAWKFSSKKAAARIHFGKETGPDQHPVYFVKDNGAGFDMSYADKLFGTFQRLHSPDEFSGTGIGLATVRRIVTRHGGRVWAQSQLGEGSTFYFTIGTDQGVASAEHNARNDYAISLARGSRARHLFDGVDEAVTPGAAPISSDNDAFAANDHQFSNAFEHAAIGMALIALNSQRLRVNSAFCKMLGYSEAEMMSRTIQDITHPDDIEWDLLQRQRALAGEIETYQWEKRYIHRSGAVVWGHLSCSLVRDADRKPMHFIVQVQDITQRKLTESVLRESEERFRTLTALASDWFWEQDENFRFVQVTGNAGDQEMTTGAGHLSLGKTPGELTHVQMDEAVWAAHRTRLERHETFRDLEVTRVDRDGQLRYVSISGMPIFDAAGKFTGYRGTGRDITEIRRVNVALKTSEEQLRDITDTLPAIISYVDADQRFRFHNRAYAEGLGVPREEINGRTMREVLGDKGYELAYPWIRQVLSGYPVTFERHRQRPNGEFRDFIVNYFPKYADRDGDGNGEVEGKVIGFYSLGTDITELKRINRLKSEFILTVGGELREPLGAVRNSLGSMLNGVEEVLTHSAQARLATASQTCDRLIRLIDDMLVIEAMETEAMHIEFAVVKLKPLLEGLLAVGGRLSHFCRLEWNVPDEHVRINVDSRQLAFALSGLVSTALLHCPKGTSADLVVTRTGVGVRVGVTVAGSPLSQVPLARLFEKPPQGMNFKARQEDDAVPNLHVARAVVERMGGRMNVEVWPHLHVFFLELPEWSAPP